MKNQITIVGAVIPDEKDGWLPVVRLDEGADQQVIDADEAESIAATLIHCAHTARQFAEQLRTATSDEVALLINQEGRA